MKKVKFRSYSLAIVSASIVALAGCGGGGGSGNVTSVGSSSLLQVSSGNSVQINLTDTENLLTVGGCTYINTYDKNSEQISIDNPMPADQYILTFLEQYTHHNDSIGIYYYLSSGITPDYLVVGKTYDVPARETQIYKLSISTTKSYSHSSQRMNASIYDSELNDVGFWNKGQIYTLDAGTYYIVSYPAYCTDGQNSFSINEVQY